MIQNKETVRCNLCEGRETKTLCAKFGLPLVECRRCGLIYANPRLTEPEILKRYESPLFFDEYLRSLSATASDYDLAFIKNHYYLPLGLLERIQTREKTLLDIGCGAGFFLKAAEESGWKAYGVEISKLGSEYSRNVVGVNVLQGKTEDAAFPSESFDLVTMLDIIEHLRDPTATLMEIRRLLRRGGILIVSTPDFSSLSRRFLGNQWAALSPAEHLYNFTQKTLSLMLKKAKMDLLGIHNLLVFNPDYTHARSGLSHSLWKKVHRLFETLKAMENLHGFEYLEVLNSVGTENPQNALPRGWKRMKRNLYRKSKGLIRGDLLMAIAQKK